MSSVKMAHILPKQKNAPHNCGLLVCFGNLELDEYLPKQLDLYTAVAKKIHPLIT